MKPQQELEYLKDFIELTEHQAQKRNDLERFLYRYNKTLLIDADSLLFNVAHFHLDDASEIDDNYEEFLSQAREIANHIEDNGYEIEDMVYFFTTCKNNFRKDLDPNYKANRPVNEITKFVKELKNYTILRLEDEGVKVHYSDTLEADDLIRPESSRDTIICSIDKDLKQIEGCHFDYYKKKTGDIDEFLEPIKAYKGFTFTTKQEGYEMLLNQLLVGDTSDNIKGVVGVGKVKAKKLLDGRNNFGKLRAVYEAYNNRKQLETNIKLMKL